MRLNRFIASSGLCSRRKADLLIAQGRVQVNGQVMQNFSYMVQTCDQVLLDHQPLRTAQYQYIKLHKPIGYLTTMHDDRGRATVYQLLPPSLQHLRPVGRLDYNSSGLLLLSNDGDFVYRLTHPSAKVAKRYLVTAQGLVTNKQLAMMRRGIRLEDGMLAFANAKLCYFTKGISGLEMVLYQGLNRQIRKMLSILGHQVLSLQRIAHGPFQLGDLTVGKIQKIGAHELEFAQTKLARGVRENISN